MSKVKNSRKLNVKYNRNLQKLRQLEIDNVMLYRSFKLAVEDIILEKGDLDSNEEIEKQMEFYWKKAVEYYSGLSSYVNLMKILTG